MYSLFYQPAVEEGHHYLTPEESRHCVKVLRKRKGDSIAVTDGKGHLYTGKVIDPDTSRCTFSIESTRFIPRKNCRIHLAVSPTKNSDRMEWMTEKCVELGIDELTFVLCQHTERKVFNTSRVERVALSAMKQSQRVWLPAINGLKPLSQVVGHISSATTKFIAHVDANNPVLLFHTAKAEENYLVLIGPEGDFSTEELEIARKAGFRSVSLGDARLRTETAGIAACHILNLINSNTI